MLPTHLRSLAMQPVPNSDAADGEVQAMPESLPVPRSVSEASLAQLVDPVGDGDEIIDADELLASKGALVTSRSVDAPESHPALYSDDIEVAVQAAWRGELTGGQNRHVRRLRARHMPVVKLAAQGYNAKQISRLLERRGVQFHPQYISAILRHPDAQALLAKMAANAARHLATQDILESASKEAAVAMLDTLRTTKSEAIRVKVGFGLLDRAGHGPTTKIERQSQPDGDTTMPREVAKSLGRLVDVLTEAQRVKQLPDTPAVVITGRGRASPESVSTQDSPDVTPPSGAAPSPRSGSPEDVPQLAERAG